MSKLSPINISKTYSTFNNKNKRIIKNTSFRNDYLRCSKDLIISNFNKKSFCNNFSKVYISNQTLYNINDFFKFIIEGKKIESDFELLEAKNKYLLLEKKYKIDKSITKDFFRVVDWKNIDKHLLNLEILLKNDVKNIAYIVDMGGFFSSDTGADALEYVFKNFSFENNILINYHDPLEDKDALDAEFVADNKFSQISMILLALSPEEILLAKKRKVTDFNEIIKTSRLNDEELSLWASSPYKNKLNYVSINPEINKLFLALKDCHADYFRYFDKIISAELVKNSEREKNILDFYRVFFASLENDPIQIQECIENGNLNFYKRAYGNLLPYKIKNVKFLFVNKNKQNLHKAIGIEDDNYKWYQIKNDWNVAIFDEIGNFIRADNSKTSDLINDEYIINKSGSIKYRANIRPDNTSFYMKLLNKSKKEVFDNNGILQYVEKYQRSKEEFLKNKYEIIREFPDANVYKVAFAESSHVGDIISERNITSDSGLLTNQFYYQSIETGSILNYIKIADDKGQILTENNYRFKYLDENHYVATENGLEYDIKYNLNVKDENVVVTRSDGKKVEIKFYDDSIICNEDSDNKGVLSSLLKYHLVKMPGSFYFAIDKYGLKKLGLNILEVEAYNALYNHEKVSISLSKQLCHSLFIIAHEFGHFLDDFLGISKNPDVIKTYLEERNNLIENASLFEIRSIDYFTHVHKNGNFEKSIKEIVAEINAILYASNQISRIEFRGQLLLQYFPKTFAKVANLLQQEKNV